MIILMTGSRGTIGSYLKTKLEQNNHFIIEYTYDVTNLDHLEFFIASLSKIDALITLAGIQNRSNFLEFTSDDFEDIIKTNLLGTFYIAQRCAQIMSTQGHGKIITCTSLTSQIGLKNMSAYVASKAGVLGLTRAMASELAEYNIQVNAVAPGRIVTDMSKDVCNEQGLSLIPSGRYGKPSDLWGIFEYLLSDKSNYTTGQEFVVDGGWLAAGGNL
jgi:NAD(P)-dependent dehydrogenase (short-subunit alcohol dehydrogenase family)